MRRLLLLICLATCALAACAQTPTDVPTGHWAYEAVNDLAEKGYVVGYPDGKFLGNRQMSRYEFAVLIKRVVDGLESKMSNTGDSTTAAAPTQVAAPAGVSPEDLAAVSKLVEEFKVELTVIGTRLDKVEADLADVKSKVDDVNSIVTDPEGAFEATRADVAKLKKITVSGYLQARYQMLQNPEDRVGTNDDTFRIRRARVKFTAKPTAKSMAVIQFDAGDTKVGIKDAYLQYNFATDQLLGPSFLVGQQNWWFGYDVPYSSSRRETPERSLWARRFFTGERDRGALFRSPIARGTLLTLGVYDGSGIDTVNTQTSLLVGPSPGTFKNVTTASGSVARDYNSRKDFLANIKYTGASLEYGLSGYLGKGIWNPARTAMNNTTDKVRFGADLRLFWDSFSFKAEYCRAKGIDGTDPTKFDVDEWVDGYYGQVAFNLTRQDELVARYESLSQDPLNPAFGRRSAWNLGYIRFLDDNQKMKLFYQINEEEVGEIQNNSLIAEWLVAY